MLSKTAELFNAVIGNRWGLAQQTSVHNSAQKNMRELVITSQSQNHSNDEQASDPS
jgi:hypothetical protein